MKVKKIGIVLAAALVFAAVAGLAGCKGGNIHNDPSKLVISLPGPFKADYKSILKNSKTKNDKSAQLTKYVVDKFEAEHPGKTIVLQDKGWGSALNEALMRANMTNTLPDIIGEEMYLKLHAGSEILIPIDLD